MVAEVPQVLFAHGLQSAPHGAKFHALRDAGLDVVAPDCREQSLPARVRLLTAALDCRQPRVLVGSSYGGLAGLLAATLRPHASLEGLVLCAPALALPDPEGMTRTCRFPTIVIHGRADNVCPLVHSERFVHAHPLAQLRVVDDDHRLSHSLPTIVSAVWELLAR